MHNLYAIFVKILGICKKFSNGLVGGRGNTRRPGTFFDIAIIDAINRKTQFFGDTFYRKTQFLKVVFHEKTHLMSKNILSLH